MPAGRIKDVSITDPVPNTTEALGEQVRTIISRISRIPSSELADDVNVREEVGIDSLMAMEIVANCEKRFGVVIDESRYAEIETIGDFLRLIASLVPRKGI
jgi:acyl carrier protein